MEDLVYKPREKNVIQEILQNHFKSFEENYDTQYSGKYGKYRIIRIKETVERFIECGDYLKGMARIKCTNPHCGHEYFRPFVASLKYACKAFYLCPSCSQKRTLVFSENMANDVLLRLPHRHYVWTLPRALRVFFKHDRKLFGEVSRLIFQMIQTFYNEAAGKRIRTAAVLCFQTAGDFLRFNSLYHGMVLEGGFDEEGNFVFIPFDNLDKMSEYFRRMIIKFFLDKKLINERFSRNLLTWRHSGFSINNEIRIYGWDEKARENLSQYIARPPISLKKLFYEPFHSKVLFKTKYNDYFKENLKMFDVQDFIADLTLHIPPKNVQYIRRYGLSYSGNLDVDARSYCMCS